MVIEKHGHTVTINKVNTTDDVPQSEAGPAMDKYTTIILYNNAGTVTVPAHRPSLYAQLCDLWNQQGIKVGE